MPNKAAQTASKSGTRTRMEQLVAEVDKVISKEKPNNYKGKKVAKISKKK